MAFCFGNYECDQLVFHKLLGMPIGVCVTYQRSSIEICEPTKMAMTDLDHRQFIVIEEF